MKIKNTTAAILAAAAMTAATTAWAVDAAPASVRRSRKTRSRRLA